MKPIKLFLFCAFIILFSTVLYSQYKIPPDEILEILNTEMPPEIYFVNFEKFSIEYSYEKMPSLSRLAEPYLGLGGVRISPRLNAVLKRSVYNHLAFVNYETGERFVPDTDIHDGIRAFKLSPDNRFCAFSVETGKGIILYIADISQKTTYRIRDINICDVYGDDGFYWIDNSNLYISKIPSDRGRAPDKPVVPPSPIIDESHGSSGLILTFQNLLSNAHDIELFDYYFTFQPAICHIDDMVIKNIGEPGTYSNISISPDSNYLLLSRIEKPYSYIFPYLYFPRTTEVWDISGNLVFTVSKQPLLDYLPQGGVETGPRSISWQAHHDALLVWAEALDEGNPEKIVEHRDKIMRLNAPFTGKPEEIARTIHRFSGIEWSQQRDVCIIHEFDRDRIWLTSTLYNLKEKTGDVIFDLSARDLYNSPGALMKIVTPRNEEVFIHKDNTVFYNNSRGATPEGNYPYLGRYNLLENNLEILYRSAKDAHESTLGFYGPDFDLILISSEKSHTQKNYFIIELETGEKKQLTFHENPYPQITGLRREIVRYERKDGLQLSGTLYYPLGYTEGERVPLVISAYPREYTDLSTAEQVSASPNSFISFYGSSSLYLTLCGYAVLQGAAIPIVGDPQTVNDTFIEQTLSSVQAAVDFLSEKGIADPDRVGITGHSYGAFMVATVLGNSSICRAGMAQSGAYNRTLTPFGFQGERRTLWEARDFYVNVSPFMYADQIKTPILFIHGENDSNPGTYTIQTERMFQAVKGTGGIARMVILPHEGHGYFAEESIKHVLAEMIEWFDRFLGNSEKI